MDRHWLSIDLVSIGTKTLNFSNQNQTVDNFEIKWPNYHELLTNLPLDWGFFIDVDQLGETAVLNIGIFIPNELTYRVCPMAALSRDIDPKNLRGTIWYWNLADVRRKEICMTAIPTTVRPNYASRSVVRIGSSVGVYKDYDGALHFMVDDKDLGIAVEKISRRYYYGWIRIGGGNVKITHRADISLGTYFRHVALGKAISKSPHKTSNNKKPTPAATKERKEQKGKKEKEKAQSQASRNDHQGSAESASAHTDETAVNPRPLYVYRMTNKPRGHCLIINNSRFHDQSRNREGADADEGALKSLFEEMHFIVTIKNNLKANEMNDLLYDFARKDHQHFDAFVCVVMTHGRDNNVLLGVDDRMTTLENLMTEVKPTNCRSLQGKPKFFIVQACRGESRESVASSYCPSSTSASHYSSYRSHIDTNMDADGLASLDSDSTLPRAMCPIEGDFLLACATTPGYVALRDPRNGSIFVQVLVDVFRKNRNNYHVLDLLVEVNRRVAERVEELTEGTYWQIPAPTFTLRGVFYFQD